MSLDDNPDFIGSWLHDPSCDSPTYRKFLASKINPGFFQLYIDEREKEGNKERVKGRIKDSHGNATFEGELSGGEVQFLKKYTPETLSKTAAARSGVKYEGKNKGKGYEGIYTVINGITADGTRGNFSHPFIMWKNEHAVI